MAPSPYHRASSPRPAGAQPRLSADGTGREYGPSQRYLRPKGKYDTLCLFSRPRPPDLMIPGAFGSEITKDSSDDEVLRWHRGHRVATADLLHPSAGKSGSIPALEL